MNFSVSELTGTLLEMQSSSSSKSFVIIVVYGPSISSGKRDKHGVILPSILLSYLYWFEFE